MEGRRPEAGSPAGRWQTERRRGPAGALLAATAGPASAPGANGPAGGPGRRTLTWYEVVEPAVVIGSGQPVAHVDAAAAGRAGLDVVRRRSGGGAVLVGPGEVLWGDVEIGRTDPLWEVDVGRAAWWLGDAWASALADVGVPATSVHRGPVVRTAWSDMVCFAGAGPGEVLAGGRKCVGISQRRTRATCRFQFAVMLRWEPGRLLDVLALDRVTRERARRDLLDAAEPVEVAPAALAAAFERRLP